MTCDIMSRGNINCTNHNLRKNCLLKHVTAGKTEGGVEVMGRGTIRSKQEDAENWKKALDGTLLRIRLDMAMNLL
jgi:hypothetical protein